MKLFSEQSYQLFFIGFLLLYTSVLSVYHLTGTNALKALTNLMAVGTIGYSLTAVLVNAMTVGVRKKPALHLLLVAIALVLHLMVNGSHTDYVDLLKFFSLFLFVFIGIGMGWSKLFIPTKVLAFLFLLPLLVEVLGGSRVYHSGISFGFFPNANTAVMYYSVLLAVYLNMAQKSSTQSMLFTAVALFFQKLGAMLAVACSLAIVHFKVIFRYLPVVVLATVIGGVAAHSMGLLDRVFEVLGGLIELYSYNSFYDVADMSYAEIIIEIGSTDLSAVFRLKHWSEIISHYLTQGVPTYLFGFGARESMVFTTEGLMPHSDIIRVLCELGVVLFLLFISMYLLHLMVGIKTNESHYV
ncbi:hypothetical protein [Vibrio sp. TBV020]|uniref:hypothetical protein n=1 Tax=Vibrio sp. TBV020 TaxID=3137398 RepID=UPI0038CD761C